MKSGPFTSRLKQLLMTSLLVFAAVVQARPACPAWMQHDLPRLRSEETVNICQLAAGKVVLFVNTASECGFTPQFKELESLYRQYKDKGLLVIGFPSDTFFQEHSDAAKTAEVCYVNYGVTFPMLASSAVRGKNANPVFQHLNAELGAPTWNFNKYLVNRAGKAIKRFGSKTTPQDKALVAEIESLLAR